MDGSRDRNRGARRGDQQRKGNNRATYLVAQAQRRQSHLVNRRDATDPHGDGRREDRGPQVHHGYSLVVFSPFLEKSTRPVLRQGKPSG